MKFTLTIDTDNEDSGRDMVAAALDGVGSLVEDGFATDGPIRDRNGNTVGRWEMSES